MPANDLTPSIHDSIYDALAAHAPLTALVSGRIFDLGNVPEIATFPYVVLGPYLATDAGDKGADADDPGHADDFAQTIDIWDRYDATTGGGRGKMRAENVMAAIYGALHEQGIALTDSPPVGNLVLMRCKMKQLFLDADGLTMHGVMRFEGFAHETT